MCSLMKYTGAIDCSLVLMDETLSSTSAIEAIYTAEKDHRPELDSMPLYLRNALHYLAQRVELNEHPLARARIDNLVATLKDGKATSEATNRQDVPDGLSCTEHSR